jgi:anti-sigma regulatory factor (Ser/Thr protein kinase)
MPERLAVTFTGGYGFDRLERMIATVEPLLLLDEPREVQVDLRRLAFFGPTALALLLAALKRLREGGLAAPGSRILPPVSPPIFRYLARMNLIRELVGEMPEDFIRREPMGFRPCQHFLADDDYWQIAGSLTDALAEQCDVDNVARTAIRVCLDEICENVVHHADTPLGGFGAAQGWPRSASRQFEIGIVDLGVGVRASLTKNPDYAHIDDDDIAIDTALKPSVSSTPERNAGIGLFVTSMLLAENGGYMLVRSGRGEVVRGAKTERRTCDALMPGTVVSLRANMDRPLDITAIYRQLEQVQPPSPAQETAPHADHRGDDTQAR